MNSKTSSSYRPAVAIAALIAASILGGSAQAQCNAYRTYIPDLDQRRTSAPGIPGLPCNGSVHCVPTSAADAIAYMSTHGAPALTQGVVYNWFSPSSYNAQTALIDYLGVLGGTTCESGTSFTNMKNGLIAFCNARMPGALTMTTKGYSAGNPCAPNDIYAGLLCNGFVLFARGTYAPETPGSSIYERVGGHILCVRNVNDLCTPTPKIGARDPNSADSQTVNSPPGVYSERVNTITAQFRLADNSTGWRQYWEFSNDYGANLKIMDGLLTILPTFAMTGFVYFNQESTVNIIRPLNLTGPIRHTHVEPLVLPPGLGTIQSLRLSADSTTGFIISNPTPNMPAKLVLVNTGDNSTHEAFIFDGTVADACTSTLGDLFVADGRVLKCLRTTESGAVQMTSSMLLPHALMACCFDDARQQLVLLFDTSSGPVIQRYNTDLSPNPVEQNPCPPGVVFDGQAYLTIDPGDGSIICCSKNFGSLFRIAPTIGGGLSLVETIGLAYGASPCNPHVNDPGNILYSSNGSVVELERNATGGWTLRENATFDGYEFGANFAMSASRDGIAASTQAGLRVINIDNEVLAGVPECRADFNDDGRVNSQDFFDFLQAFFANDFYADVNDNNVINSQDFFDYIAAFFAGC